MKVTAFLNRVAVDELSMEADSVEAAVAELNTMILSDAMPGAPVTRIVVTADGEAPVILNTLALRSRDHIRMSAPPAPNIDAVQSHYVDELTKAFAVLESLAWGAVTTEEIARDENRTIEDVLRARDYPAEYGELIRFIYLARRALNQPDLPEEVGTP